MSLKAAAKLAIKSNLWIEAWAYDRANRGHLKEEQRFKEIKILEGLLAVLTYDKIASKHFSPLSFTSLCVEGWGEKTGWRGAPIGRHNI